KGRRDQSQRPVQMNCRIRRFCPSEDEREKGEFVPVRGSVAVIVVVSNGLLETRAAQAASTTIPIVFLTSVDPNSVSFPALIGALSWRWPRYQSSTYTPSFKGVM